MPEKQEPPSTRSNKACYRTTCAGNCAVRLFPWRLRKSYIDYSQKIKRSLVSIFWQFQKYFDELKSVNAFLEDVKGRGVDVDSELEKLGGDVIRVIENGYALASILVDVITTPLFKLKKINGEVVRNGDGVPEMEKDADGSMILNGAELDAALRKAKNEANDVGDVR